MINTKLKILSIYNPNLKKYKNIIKGVHFRTFYSYNNRLNYVLSI